jgi:hypothetical protein
MPKTVKVNRDELLDAIRKNRETHREQFSKARDGYDREVARLAREASTAARSGVTRKLGLEIYQLPVPEDHTVEYNREIRMLEMSVDSVIEIESHLFDEIVMDQWSWSDAFAGTNQRYSAGS